PEFGTLVLRDLGRPVRPSQVGPSPVGALLEEHATKGSGCGSFARAGNGWLHGNLLGGDHPVVLGAHDGPPGPDARDWVDVLETPYASTGEVGLMLLTWSPVKHRLELGPPGCYRVRIARRPASGETGEVWRLQFWPVATPPEAPRWFVRGRPFLDRPE